MEKFLLPVMSVSAEDTGPPLSASRKRLTESFRNQICFRGPT